MKNINYKKETMKIRQGDILFTKNNVLEKISGKPMKEIVIAQGEVTFHNHVLVAELGSKIYGNKTKFTVKGEAKLVHPEHDTINFTSGTYIVSMEREFDYIEENIKKVQD
jgi:hypothetical protein